MTKQETARYLVDLLSLISGQDVSGVNLRSTTLAAEYEREWAKLKEMIKKEQSDETGRSNPLSKRSYEARNDDSLDRPRWSEPNRPSAGNPAGRGTLNDG